MNKKIVIYIICCILFIPVSVYIGYYINGILTNNIQSINIFEILSIISDKRILSFSIVFEALFMVLFFMVIFTSKYGIFKSSVENITSKISIPKQYGQGQYGTSRFLNKKEFDSIYEKIKLDRKNNLPKISRGGIVVKYKNNFNIEEISIVGDNKHVLCLGSTGAGKTRRILIESLCTLGLAQESILVSDPKGELFQMTSEFFRRKNYKVNVIDFKSPRKSNKYNFLQPIIDAINQDDVQKAENLTWDLVECIVPKSGNNSDPLWENGEKSIIAGSIITVLFENKYNYEYQNLTNVYNFISHMCQTDEIGYMPLNDYIENLSDENPAKKIFSISTIAPEKTRSSFFTSALATLRLFSSNSIYTMTNNSDFKLEDIGEEKCITYIILPDEKTTYYSLATLFVSQQYQALVDLADKRGGKLKIRNNFILEEFGNFTKISNFENMLTVSRGRNIRFSLFIQSFSQLESKYSKTIAQNIMDNTQVWIYLKTSSVNTAEIISKRLGKYTVSINSRSNSYNRNNISQSESMNLVGRNLLTPDEILRFETPYCLILQSGQYSAITQVPDLSCWNFNNMLGLRDEEKNRIIRERVKNDRKILKEEKINLWKVWEDYRY